MMTIGELIRALEACKPEQPVEFDFCGLMPTSVHADRGYYDHAAIGWNGSEYWHGSGGLKLEQYPTAASLLKILRSAIKPGRTFTAWKGGEYSYNESTPIHVDNFGESHSTELVRVTSDGYSAILHTAHED